MGYAFVSYSRKQLYFAESVVLALQRGGLEIWFDLQRLTPGTTWSEGLKDGVEHCERLVLIASQAAMASNHVKVEWEAVLDRGREVIVILSEAVDLPQRLQGCPLYDARVNFDMTVEALAGYLHGAQPARSDALPKVERSLLAQHRPRDVSWTAGLFCMPTLAIWTFAAFTALRVPIAPSRGGGDTDVSWSWPWSWSWSEFSLHILHISGSAEGGGFLFRPFLLLVGLLLGWKAEQNHFPVREFLRRDVGFDQLRTTGDKLLLFWLAAAAITWVGGLLDAEYRPVFIAAGLGSSLMFLFSLRWRARILPRSADLLRWLPSGAADEKVRATVQVAREHPVAPTRAVPPRAAIRPSFGYALNFHPADANVAESVDSIVKPLGCRATAVSRADVQFVLVSNRTSIQWLLQKNEDLDGRIINILVTNIHTPPELQSVLEGQWVDFRNGRATTIQSMAVELADVANVDDSYASQVSPTGFNNPSAFPRSIRLFFGRALLPPVCGMLVINALVASEWIQALLALPFAIPYLLFVQALITRRRPIPAFLSRRFGSNSAWFAARAPMAADPIGNNDASFLYHKDFLLFRDVSASEYD